MHDMFADWYRLVDLKPDAETLTNRWHIINEYRKEASTEQWLDVIRIFLGADLSAVRTSGQFAQLFKAADPLFSLANDIELRVLAGAALIHRLSVPAPDADTVALGLASAYFAGRGPQGTFPGAVEQALQYLQDEGLRVREESDALAQVKLSASLKDFKKIDLPDITATQTWAALESHFRTVVEWNNELLTVLRRLQSSFSSAVEAFKKTTSSGTIGALKEESNILWWLFSERSRDLQTPFAEIGFPGGILLVSKEVADLTALLPGPASIGSVLGKALANCGATPEKVRLKDAVNAAPRDWREQWMSSLDSSTVEDLTPIIRSIRLSLSTGEPETWTPAYDKSGGLKAKLTLAPLDLATQLYTESLLVRSILQEEA